MEERDGTSGPWERVLLGLGALALAWAGTAACGYRFGVGDQAQYLVRYVAVADPGALGDDPYLGAFGALRSVVWDALALATPEGALAGVALALTLAAAWATALGLASIARAMAPGWRGATGVVAALMPAAALVVPKELNWFGLVALSDVELTATVLVTPMMAWAMALFVRGRAWWSLALLAAAAPVQGQMAAWGMAAWVFASAWERRGSARRLAPVAAVMLAGAAAALAVRSGSGVDAADMERYRAIGVRLYAVLIDPSRAPAAAWASVGAVVAVGVVGFAGLARMRGGDRSAIGRLAAFAAASCVAPVGAIALIAAGVDEPVLWKLMPGRGLGYAQIAAVVAAAAWAAGRALAGGRGAWAAAAVLVGLVAWPFPVLGAAGGAVGIGVVLALAAVGVWAPEPAGEGGGGRLLAGPALTAIGVGVAAFAVREHPWVRPAATPAWREAQLWARANTAPGTVFVTPPYRAGWRVGSRRPTFGELRDGGLLFYAGEPALAWADRMRTLGMTGYGAAWFDEGAFDGERRAYADAVRGGALANAGARYLVCEIDPAIGEIGVGERVWTNGVYEIRSVPPDPGSGGP